MSDFRNSVAKFVDVHPNVALVLVVGLLLFDTLIGSVALYKVTQQQNTQADQQTTLQLQQTTIQQNQVQFQRQARSFAHIQCTTSNDARGVLRDLLQFIEQRTVTNAKQQGATQEEIDGLKDFYNDALARIVLTTCPKL